MRRHESWATEGKRGNVSFFCPRTCSSFFNLIVFRKTANVSWHRLIFYLFFLIYFNMRYLMTDIDLVTRTSPWLLLFVKLFKVSNVFKLLILLNNFMIASSRFRVYSHSICFPLEEKRHNDILVLYYKVLEFGIGSAREK